MRRDLRSLFKRDDEFISLFAAFFEAFSNLRRQEGIVDVGSQRRTSVRNFFLLHSLPKGKLALSSVRLYVVYDMCTVTSLNRIIVCL